MKQVASDVSCVSAGGETSGRSHDSQTLEGSPAHGTSSCERTCSSLSQTLQLITTQHVDCSEPVIDSAPAKSVSKSSPAKLVSKCSPATSAAKGRTTLKSVPVSVRRSSRALKVKRYGEPTAASHKAVTSPKCSQTAHVSPVHPSPGPKSGKSFPASSDLDSQSRKSLPARSDLDSQSGKSFPASSDLDSQSGKSVPAGSDPKSLSIQDGQSVHSSPRTTMPCNKDAVSSDAVNSGPDVKSLDGACDNWCMSDKVELKTREHVEDKRSCSLPKQSDHKSVECSLAGNDPDIPSAANTADIDSGKITRRRRSSPRKVDRGGQDVKCVGGESDRLRVSDDVSVESKQLSDLFRHKSTSAAAVVADLDSSRMMRRTRHSSPGKVYGSGPDVKSVGDEGDHLLATDDVSVDNKPLCSLSEPSGHSPSLSAAAVEQANSSEKTSRTRRSSPRRMADSGQDVKHVDGDQLRISDEVNSDEKALITSSKQSDHTHSISATGTADCFDSSRKILCTRRSSHRNLDSSGQDVKPISDQQHISDEVNSDEKPLITSCKQSRSPPAAGTADCDSSRKMPRTRRSGHIKPDSSEQDVKSVSVDGDQMCISDNVIVCDKLSSNSLTQSENTSSPSAAVVADSDLSMKMLRTRRCRPRRTDSIVASEPVISRRGRKSVDVERESLRVTDDDESKPVSNSSQEQWKLVGSGLDVISALSAAGIDDSNCSVKTLRTRRSSPRKMDSIAQETSTLSQEQWKMDGSGLDVKSVSAENDQLHISDDVSVGGKQLSSLCKEHISTLSATGIDDSNSSVKTLRTRRSSPRKMDGSAQETGGAESDQLCTSHNVNASSKPLTSNLSKQSEHAHTPSAAGVADSDSSRKILRTRRSSPRKVDSSGQGMKSVNVDSDQMCISEDNVDDKPLSSLFKHLEHTPTLSAAATADSHSSRRIVRTQRSCLRKAGSTVTSDTVCIRRSRKSVGVEEESSVCMTDDEDNKPLSTLLQELQRVPDEATLQSDGAAELAKKMTGGPNRRNLSYSGQPQEKRPRSRVRSLERGHCRKSAAHTPQRRTSRVSAVDAGVESDSAPDLPSVEDSGRRLTRPRKCNTRPAPADNEARLSEQEDAGDLLQRDEELTSKTELGDTDGSSTTAASSDDVRSVQIYM